MEENKDKPVEKKEPKWIDGQQSDGKIEEYLQAFLIIMGEENGTTD